MKFLKLEVSQAGRLGLLIS